MARISGRAHAERRVGDRRLAEPVGHARPFPVGLDRVAVLVASLRSPPAPPVHDGGVGVELQDLGRPRIGHLVPVLPPRPSHGDGADARGTRPRLQGADAVQPDQAEASVLRASGPVQVRLRVYQHVVDRGRRGVAAPFEDHLVSRFVVPRTSVKAVLPHLLGRCAFDGRGSGPARHGAITSSLEMAAPAGSRRRRGQGLADQPVPHGEQARLGAVGDADLA